MHKTLTTYTTKDYNNRYFLILPLEKVFYLFLRLNLALNLLGFGQMWASYGHIIRILRG